MNKVLRVVGLGIGFAAWVFGGYLLTVTIWVGGFLVIGLFALLVETVFHSVVLNVAAILVGIFAAAKAVNYFSERRA